MQTGILIYNPASGRQHAERLVDQLLVDLRGQGFQLEPRPTAGPGDATRMAHATTLDLGTDAGAEVVFALGGDGTLRESAAGLVGSRVALGFLPTGTVNVMARALGVPARPRAAARQAGRLEPLAVDVGCCGSDVFLMMASCGLDAEIMARQRPSLKRFWGRSAVVATGIGAWWQYDYPSIEVAFDGQIASATLVAACNIPYYGGAFKLAPSAEMTDGKLDLVLFRGQGRRSALGLAGDVALGRHTERGDIEFQRISHAVVHLPNTARLQVDGARPCSLKRLLSVASRMACSTVASGSRRL